MEVRRWFADQFSLAKVYDQLRHLAQKIASQKGYKAKSSVLGLPHKVSSSVLELLPLVNKNVKPSKNALLVKQGLLVHVVLKNA